MAACGFKSHGFRSTVPWSPVAKAALLQSDDRWFESTRDYCCPGTPMAERLGLNPSGCRFKSCLGHSEEHGSVGNWQTTLARAPPRSGGRRDAVGSTPT